MLVLSRRIGEVIKIGDNISLIVLNIGGNQVKLGIDAPKDVNIVREKLLIRGAENKRS